MTWVAVGGRYRRHEVESPSLPARSVVGASWPRPSTFEGVSKVRHERDSQAKGDARRYPVPQELVKMLAQGTKILGRVYNRTPTGQAALPATLFVPGAETPLAPTASSGLTGTALYPSRMSRRGSTRCCSAPREGWNSAPSW